MEAIFIKNKIQLIENFTSIEVKVICPRKNIQTMLDTTKGHFISKKEIILPYNHNAGQVFEVIIRAKFENLKRYLKKDNFYNFKAENEREYKDLIKINEAKSGGYFYQTTQIYAAEIRGLYSFGDCSTWNNSRLTTFYWYANGRRIELNNTERTNYGNKRYVQNAGKWLSNKKY